MLSDRLIKMIENHADELTRGAVENLRNSPHTPSYKGLSHDDLYQRVYKVCTTTWGDGWRRRRTMRCKTGITNSGRSASTRAYR